MNNKAFVILLLGVIILGGAFGGGFVGGMMVGGTQKTESSEERLTGSTQDLQHQPFSQQSGDDLRQQFLQRFQGQDVAGRAGAGFGGRTSLRGNIESLDGNTVTVNTSQGPLLATIGEETVITRFAEATLNELVVGMNVTVTGAPSEDGAVKAISIMVIPEGQAGIFGGRPSLPLGGQ